MTPSNVAPRFGAEMATLLAYGRAFIPSCGKMVRRKSNASCDENCFSSLTPSLSLLSGLKGGVASRWRGGTTRGLGMSVGVDERGIDM